MRAFGVRRHGARRAAHAGDRAGDRAAGDAAGGAPTSIELTELLRLALPPGFEAVGEALAAERGSVIAACWVAGRDQADAGIPLGESLEGLRSTTRLVRDRDPSYAETHALANSWSEATLCYLHNLSCADPLTGLATLAHVREHIAGLYRDVHDDARSHALVITELHPVPGLDPLAAKRRLSLLGDTVRSVFAGQEVVGQLGPARIVAVARRDEALATRVALLRRMVEDRADRVWIEGLPASDASAALVLDELARGG